MARVNGRMPHKTCSRGCCEVGETIKQRREFIKQELELADDELNLHPGEVDDDPDWDGKLSTYDLPEDVPGVKFTPADEDPWGNEDTVRCVRYIPAPPDDSGW